MRTYKNGRWVKTPQGIGIIFALNAAFNETDEETGELIYHPASAVIHLTKGKQLEFKKEIVLQLNEVTVLNKPLPARKEVKLPPALIEGRAE